MEQLQQLLDFLRQARPGHLVMLLIRPLKAVKPLQDEIENAGDASERKAKNSELQVTSANMFSVASTANLAGAVSTGQVVAAFALGGPIAGFAALSLTGGLITITVLSSRASNIIHSLYTQNLEDHNAAEVSDAHADALKRVMDGVVQNLDVSLERLGTRLETTNQHNADTLIAALELMIRSSAASTKDGESEGTPMVAGEGQQATLLQQQQWQASMLAEVQRLSVTMQEAMQRHAANPAHEQRSDLEMAAPFTILTESGDALPYDEFEAFIIEVVEAMGLTDTRIITLDIDEHGHLVSSDSHHISLSGLPVDGRGDVAMGEEENGMITLPPEAVSKPEERHDDAVDPFADMNANSAGRTRSSSSRKSPRTYSTATYSDINLAGLAMATGMLAGLSVMAWYGWKKLSSWVSGRRNRGGNDQDMLQTDEILIEERSEVLADLGSRSVM